MKTRTTSKAGKATRKPVAPAGKAARAASPPAGGIRPLADRVLLRRLEEGEVSPGGIVIPDTAKEKPQRAEVVAVGPGRLTREGRRVPSDLEKGDHVLIGKYSGTEVRIRHEEFVIVREDEVFATLGR